MLISIILGLFLGLIIVLYIKRQKYHGPDSNNIRKKIYFDKKTKTFFKFIPKQIR